VPAAVRRQCRLHERGLAGAGVAEKNGHRFRSEQAVFDRAQGLPEMRGHVYETRVGRQLEGELPESVEVLVHVLVESCRPNDTEGDGGETARSPPYPLPPDNSG